MTSPVFPRSQMELLKMARGDRSQREFAEQLRVEKSCLSRYENGKLGAPVKVVDQCLVIVADIINAVEKPRVAEALQHAKLAVSLLEGAPEASVETRSRHQ